MLPTARAFDYLPAANCCRLFRTEFEDALEVVLEVMSEGYKGSLRASLRGRQLLLEFG
jgi:hypothetical protein